MDVFIENKLMDILKNIVLRNNEIINTNITDYIRNYFQEYFCYQYDSDINVWLEPLTAEINEYTLLIRYRNMLDDIPNINSGFLKYINLTEKRQTYGLKHVMAKSLIMYPNGWESLGIYFTDECKQRFKNQYKKEFDFIIGLIKINSDLKPYKINYKSIIDYINVMYQSPILNIYSFNKNGETRKKWYSIEDIENKTNYKVNIYDKNGLYIKTIDKIIPKGYIYKYINHI